MELKKPIFGICLGCQIMALAAGAKTYKLKFGHRAQNQPCIDTETDHCYITSQNHGFAIDSKSLPASIKISHYSLFDRVIQGIEHKNYPFFSVQYHPESSPGPHDSRYLFKKFKDMVLDNSSYAKKKRY